MIDDRWGVVLLEPESRGVQSLMYPQGLAEHPPAGLNVVGAAAYARPISKPPSKRADIVESMKTGGPAPTSRQLKALAAWLASASSTTGDPRGSSLLVRWALGDPAEADNDDISTLRRSLGGRDADSRPILREAWHRYILDQAIPYDRTAREELIQSADAAPLGRYIDTWRRIRHVPS
jgi:hypothetical protein